MPNNRKSPKSAYKICTWLNCIPERIGIIDICERAISSGGRGQRFESSRARHSKPIKSILPEIHKILDAQNHSRKAMHKTYGFIDTTYIPESYFQIFFERVKSLIRRAASCVFQRNSFWVVEGIFPRKNNGTFRCGICFFLLVVERCQCNNVIGSKNWDDRKFLNLSKISWTYVSIKS